MRQGEASFGTLCDNFVLKDEIERARQGWAARRWVRALRTVVMDFFPCLQDTYINLILNNKY